MYHTYLRYRTPKIVEPIKILKAKFRKLEKVAPAEFFAYQANINCRTERNDNMADPAYAAHQMRYRCETLNIGYSQPHRNNIYNGSEADCSSLVLRCCKDAGIPTGNAYSTRDMRREMIKAGWQVYNGVAATKASNLISGDVLR